MSRFFVDKQPVPVIEFDHLEVSDPQQNAVWVKPRMNWRDQSIYMDTLYPTKPGTLLNDETRYFQSRLLLLKLHVTKWSGPGFRDQDGGLRPCTPEAFDDLDPFEPFWTKVLDKINELHVANRRGQDDPNGPASANGTLTPSPASGEVPLETGISS